MKTPTVCPCSASNRARWSSVPEHRKHKQLIKLQFIHSYNSFRQTKRYRLSIAAPATTTFWTERIIRHDSEHSLSHTRIHIHIHLIAYKHSFIHTFVWTRNAGQYHHQYTHSLTVAHGAAIHLGFPVWATFCGGGSAREAEENSFIHIDATTYICIGHAKVVVAPTLLCVGINQAWAYTAANTYP